ncbi:hypothetical protein [Evansella tamaricis]|uniref:Uncharacterized protein n=1 Tax=Evansella tamaricis TaxID=2069301 RepID=A0ABS6JED9_9BACI|nr:hypothetical protein [Evansella tamaricis]MBU9712033.1 hypothetical protein [Evansella tamaricis]
MNEEDEEVSYEELPFSRINVWVKENFEEKRTDYHSQMELTIGNYEDFPVYTAEKVKPVKRTKEDVITTLKSYEEGLFTLRLFFESEESYTNKLEEINDILTFISESEKLETGSISVGVVGPSTDALLLEVKEFPSFVIFDTKDVVFVSNDFMEVKSFLENQ